MPTDSDTSPSTETPTAVTSETAWLGEYDLGARASARGCRQRVTTRDHVTFRCSREPGHDGRHLACGMRYLLAAWPGNAEPTAEEIAAVTS